MTYTITAWMHDGEIIGVQGHAEVCTPERAQQIAAAFPKFIRVKGVAISGFPDADLAAAFNIPLNEHGLAQREWGHVSASFSFSADRNNKGKNETGLKRLRAFLGLVDWTYRSSFANSATREQFDSFVEARS